MDFGSPARVKSISRGFSVNHKRTSLTQPPTRKKSFFPSLDLRYVLCVTSAESH